MRRFLVAVTVLVVSIASASAVSAVVFAQPPKAQRERVGTVLGKAVFRDELPKNPTYSDAVELFIAPVMNEFHQEHRHEYDMTDDEIRLAEEWSTAEAKKEGGERWEEWTAEGERHRLAAPKRLAELEEKLANPKTPNKDKPDLRNMIRISKLEATHPHAGMVWFLMRGRKFEQYLNDNYGGGRIILQQLGPEALDAQRKLILELEKKGKFDITDPELRKLAFDYWERPKHPGGFHTDRRHLAFPWTKEHQELVKELEGK